MPQCSAFNCKNRGAHLFPKDPKRRKTWETALRIKNFKASGTARLCRMHFNESDYFGRSIYTDAEPLARFLKKSAVPSVFCFTKIKPETPAALDRQCRYKRRCHSKIEVKTLDSSEEPQPSTSEDVIQSVVPDLGGEVLIMSLDTEYDVPAEAGHTQPGFSSKSTQVDHEHAYGSITRFKEDDKGIQFYTGFETYEKFQFVYATLSPMAHKISKLATVSLEDQFFMTMMKLKENKSIYELGKFFCISETTVSNIFITWINFIYELWSKLTTWPSKELVECYMPTHFKVYDKTIRVTSDGTEISVQKQKNTISQQDCSKYKHHDTLNFCSNAGSKSDQQTVEQSNLTTKCQSDSILADKFTIQDTFANNVTVKTTLNYKSQSGISLNKDRELASKRVHIERIIALTKTYKILRSALNHSYIPIANKIFFICFMCCYFSECIMKENKMHIC